MNQIKSLDIEAVYTMKGRKRLKLPLFIEKIHAGFPSPADDFVERKLDLNELLVSHPMSTFFVRVKGDSMINAGIFSGDILIVDKAIDPVDNKVVIAYINNEFTVKRIRKTKNKFFLIPENPEFQPIEIKPGMEFQVWGVVTNVIHPV